MRTCNWDGINTNLISQTKTTTIAHPSIALTTLFATILIKPHSSEAFLNGITIYKTKKRFLCSFEDGLSKNKKLTSDKKKLLNYQRIEWGSRSRKEVSCHQASSVLGDKESQISYSQANAHANNVLRWLIHIWSLAVHCRRLNVIPPARQHKSIDPISDTATHKMDFPFARQVGEYLGSCGCNVSLWRTSHFFFSHFWWAFKFPVLERTCPLRFVILFL